MPPLDHDNNPFRGNSDLGFQPKGTPAAFSIPWGKEIAKSLAGTSKRIKRAFGNTDITLDDFSNLPSQANAHDQTTGKTHYTFPEKRSKEASVETANHEKRGELETVELLSMEFKLRDKDTGETYIGIGKPVHDKRNEEAPAVITAGHGHPTRSSESPVKHPKYPVADNWGKRIQKSPEAAADHGKRAAGDDDMVKPDANQDVDAPADAGPATGADRVDLPVSIEDRRYIVQLAGEGKSFLKERPSKIVVVLPSGPLPSDEELLRKTLERATGKKVVKISKETAVPRSEKRGVEADGLVEVSEDRDIVTWLWDKFDALEDSLVDEKGRPTNDEGGIEKSVVSGGKKLQMKRQPGNVDDSQFQDVVRQINEYIVGTHGSLQKLEQQSASIDQLNRLKAQINPIEENTNQLMENMRKIHDEEMREKFKEELKGEMREEEEKQKQEEAEKFEKIVEDLLEKLKDSKENSQEGKSVILRDLTLAKRELDKDEGDEDTVTGGIRTLVTESFPKTFNDTDIGIAHFQLPDHMGGRCGPSGAWRDACPEAYFRALADTNTGSAIVAALWVFIIGGFVAMISTMAMCLYDYTSNRKPRSEMARRTRPMGELEPEDKV